MDMLATNLCSLKPTCDENLQTNEDQNHAPQDAGLAGHTAAHFFADEQAEQTDEESDYGDDSSAQKRSG